MRAALLGLALLALGACGDDEAQNRDDAGPTIDAAPGDIDAGPTSGSALDRPGLPRPPSGGLPAELRPPR